MDQEEEQITMTEEIKNTKKVYKKLLPKSNQKNGISVAHKMAESAMISRCLPETNVSFQNFLVILRIFEGC